IIRKASLRTGKALRAESWRGSRPDRSEWTGRHPRSLRGVDQRLIDELARQILDVRHRAHGTAGHHSLDDADEHHVVRRVDPEPRGRDAVPEVGTFAGRAAEAQRILEDREIQTEPEARLLTIVADAELARGFHLVRHAVRAHQAYRARRDQSLAVELAFV